MQTKGGNGLLQREVMQRRSGNKKYGRLEQLPWSVGTSDPTSRTCSISVGKSLWSSEAGRKARWRLWNWQWSSRAEVKGSGNGNGFGGMGEAAQGSGNRRPMNAYAGPRLNQEMVKAQACPDGVSQKARIVKGGYILTHGI